jgi:transcriptional regulator with XRE-family HTH domain
LANLIRSSGRSPAALAAAAGVAPSILSRFLAGARGITSDTFDRLAAALGGLRLVEVAAGRRGRSRPVLPATRDQAEASEVLLDSLPHRPPAPLSEAPALELETPE